MIRLNGADATDPGTGLSPLAQTVQDSLNTGTPLLDTIAAKIKAMQTFLAVPVTGELDDATVAAIKSFQWSKALPQTGFPNTATMAALQEAGADLASLTWSEMAWSWVLYNKWWVAAGGAVVAAGVTAGVLYARRRKRRAG